MDHLMPQRAAGAEAGPAWKDPLAGLRVLEPPGKGDETRGFAPFLAGESHYFLGLDRGKRSLVVDIRQPEGAEILRGLACASDVLIENFRPGMMDRLGLGAEALMVANPRLVDCAIRRSASLPCAHGASSAGRTADPSRPRTARGSPIRNPDEAFFF